MTTITCYRPVGPSELNLLIENGFSKWPPRLPEQPIFYPVTNEQYAKAITKWNIQDYGVGYITKFEVRREFLDRYDIHCVGARNDTEWWIPAEDLEELNSNMVGLIELVGEYR